MRTTTKDVKCAFARLCEAKKWEIGHTVGSFHLIQGTQIVMTISDRGAVHSIIGTKNLTNKEFVRAVDFYLDVSDDNLQRFLES